MLQSNFSQIQVTLIHSLKSSLLELIFISIYLFSHFRFYGEKSISLNLDSPLSDAK